MKSTREVLELIQAFSLSERLMIVEEILRSLRQEASMAEEKIAAGKDDGPAILALAGTIDDQEAAVFEEAVRESRKVDRDEW